MEKKCGTSYYELKVLRDENKITKTQVCYHCRQAQTMQFFGHLLYYCFILNLKINAMEVIGWP